MRVTIIDVSGRTLIGVVPRKKQNEVTVFRCTCGGFHTIIPSDHVTISEI